MHVVAISVFITQSYGSRAAVLGFCEARCLVSAVKYSELNFFATDGGGCIERYGSCDLKLSLFIVNRQRVSRRIYGLLCLHLYCGDGIVCLIVVAQMSYQTRRKSIDGIAEANTDINDLVLLCCCTIDYGRRSWSRFLYVVVYCIVLPCKVNLDCGIFYGGHDTKLFVSFVARSGSRGISVARYTRPTTDIPLDLWYQEEKGI